MLVLSIVQQLGNKPVAERPESIYSSNPMVSVGITMSPQALLNSNGMVATELSPAPQLVTM